MTVSCEELAQPFRNKRCPGNHQHLTGLSHGKELSQSQVWTWKEAQLVVDGVQNVLSRNNRGFSIFNPSVPAYPVQSMAERRAAVAPAQPGSGPHPGLDSRYRPMHRIRGSGSECVPRGGEARAQHHDVILAGVPFDPKHDPNFDPK